MLRAYLLVAIGLSTLSAPVFAQSRVDDSCMAPSSLMFADPYGPIATSCLSEIDVIKAKTKLRTDVKSKPALCAASQNSVIESDPYSPQSVSCRTDAQISVLVAQKQKPKSPTDGTCSRPDVFIKSDPYGRLSVSCYSVSTIENVVRAQRNIKALEAKLQAQTVSLKTLYEQTIRYSKK